MTLLLAPDRVTLYPQAGGDDRHGWALPGQVPSWAGQGNLQAQPGRSDPQASDGGGHGPFDPSATPTAVLYLPPDASPAEGMVAEARGARWVLSQVRAAPDPTGPGISCWVATATSMESWGGDGAG